MLKKITRLICCGNTCMRILNWLYCIRRKNLGPFRKKGTRDSSSRVTSIVKDIYSDMQFWNANSALGWPRHNGIYSKVSNLWHILNVKYSLFILQNTLTYFRLRKLVFSTLDRTNCFLYGTRPYNRMSIISSKCLLALGYWFDPFRGGLTIFTNSSVKTKYIDIHLSINMYLGSKFLNL